MSSVGSPHEASQSGYGGVRRTVNRASSSSQGNGSETGLRDESTAMDSRSEKAHVVCPE